MNIPTLAAKLPKKPTKRECFNIIQEGVFTETDQAKLYAYFMPTIGKPKTPFQWVAKARANKDVRYYLNAIYSDGTRTIASDGHRMHIINEVREKGYYDDNDQPINEDWRYPDIDRVIPEGHGQIIDFDTLEVRDHAGYQAYTMPDGKGVQVKFVKEAALLSDSPILEYYADRSVLKVTHDQGFAIIMGLRV